MKPATRNSGATVSQWDAWLRDPTSRSAHVTRQTYGAEPDHRAERLALIRQAVTAYGESFGDDAVRIFRAPGRVNLRGMHVDTHGGFINTITLGRETVFVAAPTDEPFVCIHNTAPNAGTVAFDRAGQRGVSVDWGRYVDGCLRAVEARFPDAPLHGMRGVIASDVPPGSGLSSSASLCAAIMHAILALHGRTLDAGALVETIQSAEWIAGARCGLGDPAAIVYGERDTILRMAFDTGCGTPASLDAVTFPDTHDVLVIDSGTKRTISGADRAAYSANRAAYSCAMEALRNELLRGGRFEDEIRSLRYFRQLKQSRLELLADNCSVYVVLLGIPERLRLDDLEHLVGAATFESAFHEHLGDVARPSWPPNCPLRGPLLYGLAESERAETFANYLALGDVERAARLMTIGHDGDRVNGVWNGRIPADVSDAALIRHSFYRTPLIECPGAYGASTPCLDALVDIALSAGALGASLTGAGLAGSVVAICDRDDTLRIEETLSRYLRSDQHAKLAAFDEPLSIVASNRAVFRNHSTDHAGEFIFPA